MWQKNGTSRRKYGKHFLTSASLSNLLHFYSCALCGCAAAATCPDSTYAYYVVALATTSNQSNADANFQNVRLNLICKIVIPVRKKQTRTSISFQSWQGHCRDEQIKILVRSQAFKGKLAAYGAVTNACGKINIPRRQAVKCD